MALERLVLVRHGGTEWSASGRHTGWTDIPLTEEGRRQARALGRRLQKQSFSLILTSPLGRSVETCRLAGFGEQAELCPKAREWDYGEYEGKTSDEIHERDPGWSLWTSGVPGGESPDQVGGRADEVLARVRTASGNALLFAHGHFLRVLCARWLGMEPARGAMFALSPAALSVLGYEHSLPAVWEWNDTAHLDGLPGGP